MRVENVSLITLHSRLPLTILVFIYILMMSSKKKTQKSACCGAVNRFNSIDVVRDQVQLPERFSPDSDVHSPLLVLFSIEVFRAQGSVRFFCISNSKMKLSFENPRVKIKSFEKLSFAHKHEVVV